MPLTYSSRAILIGLMSIYFLIWESRYESILYFKSSISYLRHTIIRYIVLIRIKQISDIGPPADEITLISLGFTLYSKSDWIGTSTTSSGN